MTTPAPNRALVSPRDGPLGRIIGAVSLSAASARGATIYTAVNLATYGLGFLATIAAARMLMPSEFGRAMVAVTVADFLVIAAAWSFPTALLREPEETVGSLFDTALVVGAKLNLAMMVVTVVIGGILAFTGIADVGPMLVAVMAGRMAANIGNFYGTDLNRRFAYGRFSAIQFGSQVAGNITMLALAAGGVGAWAVAAKDIVGNGLVLPLSFALSEWRRTGAYSAEQASELRRFARTMIGSRLGDLMFHRYDNLIVGTISGPAALGVYSQAYVLAEIGNRAYGPTLLQVPMSNYARTQGEREATSRTFNFINFWVVRSILPLFGVLFLIPQAVLTVVFGREWAAGAGMLRGLAFYALLLPFFEHVRGLLIANGRIKEVLRARAIQLAVFIPAVTGLTAAFGGVGAAIGVAISMVIGTVAITFEARAIVDLDAVKRFLSPAAAFAVAAVATVTVRGTGTPTLLGLVESAAAMIAAYLAALIVFDGRAMWTNGEILLRNLRSRRVPAAEVVTDSGRATPT